MSKGIMLCVLMTLLIAGISACAENKKLSKEEALIATIQALQTQVGPTGAGTSIPHGSQPGTPISPTQPPKSSNQATPTAVGGNLNNLLDKFPALGQIGGSSYGVAVQGNLAYLGVGPRLVALDISQPGSPVQVGQSDVFPGIVRDVQVNGDYAYVATDFRGGLMVIDVRDPKNLREVGRFIPELSGANGLILAENLVYLSCNPYGLRIVDVSDPRAPREVGSLELKGPFIDIDVEGKTAYLVVAGDGLYLVEVSNPANPTQVGFLSQTELLSQEHPNSVQFNAIDTAGGYAFLSAGDGGMAVVDVSNPSEPKLAGSFTSNTTNGITVSGNMAYLVDEFEGIYLLDISNPINPKQVGLLPSIMGTADELNVVTTGTRGVVYNAGRLFVTDQWHSLYILDVANPTEPSRLGHFQAPAPDRLVDVVVAGDIAYLIGDSSGLRVIDVSNPGIMRELSFDDRRINVSLQTPSALQIAGNFLYISDLNIGFHIYDVSDPNQPVEVGLIMDIGFVHDLYLRGNYSYLATQDWGNDNKNKLLVVDVSEPTDPQIVQQVEIPIEKDHTTWSISGEGDYLYLVDLVPSAPGGNLLYIYNLANPTVPALAGQFPLVQPIANLGSLYVKDDYAYLSSLYPPLHIYNLQNPVSPVFTGMEPSMGLGMDMEKAGNLLFGVPNYLVALDVSDPSTPKLAGMSFLPSSIFGLALAGDRVYVVGLDFGLMVFQK